MTTGKGDDQFLTNREVMSEVRAGVKNIEKKVDDIVIKGQAVDEIIYGNPQKKIPGALEDIAMLKRFKAKLERAAIWVSGASVVTGGVAFKKEIIKWLSTLFSMLLVYGDVLLMFLLIVIN